MGLCSSKSKTGATNPNAHRPRSRSDEPNIVYTKSPAPEVQIPARKPPPPPSPKRVYKSDTILGKPFEDVKQHYTMGKELGRGQFGVTYLCTHKSTGQRYACKSILKKKLVTKGDKDDMRKEIQIMQHLSGQANIVEFKGAYEDKQSVHLVMEVCEGGELFDRIIAKGHYSERAAASICRSIVNVVHVCHFMGVMHRDLKPENFLLSDKSENALLKATDFGLSVFIQEERSILGNVVFHRYCSSILFMASMTRTTDLEAIMEQHKTEVVATIAATAKRLDQMQEMIEKKIEKNKAETDKQIAEVLQLLKALQPPTTTAAATSQSIPQPPSTFTLINPLPPPRHTTPMPPPTHPLSQPIVTQPPADSNLILNQKSTEGIPNLQEELQETRSKSDSYGDTQPNPNDSLPLEIVSRGFTSSDKKVVQGKITNLSHDNLVVTTSIREKGEWLVNGHLKLPSSLSLLLLPPLGVIDVKCWNQFQFDFFPP